MKLFEARNAIIKGMKALCPMVETGLTYYNKERKEAIFCVILNGQQISNYFIHADLAGNFEKLNVEIVKIAVRLRTNISPPFNHDLKFKSIYGKEYFYLNGKRISNNLGNALLDSKDLNVSVLTRDGVPNTSAFCGDCLQIHAD